MVEEEYFLHSPKRNLTLKEPKYGGTRDMLEGWEIAEATKQKAAEFGRKCDWCERGTITHMVVGNQRRFSMVCGNCYREKNVKEIEGDTLLKKKPHRWANASQKQRRAIFKSK